MAEDGLVAAARRLGGSDVDEVCASMRTWRETSERELPWLAGPGLSALGRAGVTPSRGPHLQTLQRFLVGAETDAGRVRAALEAFDSRPDSLTSVAPDARGALVDATQAYFHVLGLTYSAMHRFVREGHRNRVDDAVAQWQTQLDTAAAQIDERALVLSGRAPQPRPAVSRRTKDRPYLAGAFAVLAIIGAWYVLWLVQRGWPMRPVDLPF